MPLFKDEALRGGIRDLRRPNSGTCVAGVRAKIMGAFGEPLPTETLGTHFKETVEGLVPVRRYFPPGSLSV